MSTIVADKPAVCLLCHTRNAVTAVHCTGCRYKIKAGPGPYRLAKARTR